MHLIPAWIRILYVLQDYSGVSLLWLVFYVRGGVSSMDLFHILLRYIYVSILTIFYGRYERLQYYIGGDHFQIAGMAIRLNPQDIFPSLLSDA